MRLGPDPTIGRLTRRTEFLAAASGRRFHSARMSLQARHRDDRESLRVGLTVTKRVGHATERNRIKRRLRSAVVALGQSYASASLDVVIIGRRDVLGSPFGTLLDDLSRGLRTLSRGKPRRDDRHSTEGRPENNPAAPDTHA